MKRDSLRRATLIVTLAAGCTPLGSGSVREQLDERTGVTVTSISAPLQFYSPQPERGLQAASFAYLGPIEINRMGQRRSYLWLSVLPGEDERSRQAGGADSIPRLRIAAGDITLEPSPVSADRSLLGLGHRVYERPADWVGEAYYAVTDMQLAQLAAADSLVLDIDITADEPRRYEAWKPDLSALRSFVEHVGAQSP
jgi:hypothetical protein